MQFEEEIIEESNRDMSIYQAWDSLLRTVLSTSHILIYFKNGSNNIKHDF